MTSTLYTCRHTFEATLCAELARLGVAKAQPLAPGLVQAPGDAPLVDPVYALQVLPNAELVCGESIRSLASALRSAAEPVLRAHAGAWQVHGLVPAQLKGNPKPPMARRAALVVEAFVSDLRKEQRALARRRLESDEVPTVLLQLLLMEVDAAWVSAAPVQPLEPHASWPSRLPAGLAEVADDDRAPASSYRKLDEALACMGQRPQPGEGAVDLGASPGGWTHVLRRCGADVVAIDRAPLAPHLARDVHVRSIAGDAFAWRPPEPVDWLVSDLIAFPERVAELLEVWCGGRLARHMVVQMKFRGDPDWLALDRALLVAREAGYHVRAKHFFNDKNEVTLMLGAQGDTRHD